MYNLRDYQLEAIEKTRESFAKGNKRVMLCAPTGSGKTVIALDIVKKAMEKGKRTGFICDRLSLLDQTAQVMYQNGLDFGIIQGQNELTDFSKDFQICSAQTLARRNYHDFDLGVIDEAHIMFKHQLNMLKNVNGNYFLGLTATPFTRGLGQYWDDLIIVRNTAELIKDGYLSEFIAYGPSKPDLTGVRMSAGDYNKKELADRSDKKELIGDIFEHWLKLASDRQTVVGGVNVAHAEHIAEQFKSQGINADVIHCYQPVGERQKKLKAFRNGDIQVLSSVDLISRGFDMPDISCLICARPTKSLNYHLQFLGRGLRCSEGKKDLLILDHAGNIERLGFPDDDFCMCLDDGKRGEKKAREKKIKLPKPCPQCFHLKPVGMRACPKCGFKTKRQSNVENKNGNLEILGKEQRNRKATKQHKEKLYAKLLAGATVLGFKDGWASYRYREYFGVWPNALKHVKADAVFQSWIDSQPKWKQNKIIWGLVPNEKKEN